MHTFVAGIFLVFLGIDAAAQDTELSRYPQQRSDSLRRQYIRSYPEYFFIWPVIKQRSLDFELTPAGASDGVFYQSNKPYSLGVGVYLFELGIELALAIPMDERSRKRYGESDATDIQLNVLGKKWGGDLFYQRYRGFYLEDKSVKTASNEPYPQRPDIATRNFGVSLNYTFNHNRFSFRSAYNYVERQLRSAGSFLLFANLSSFAAAGDSAILGQPYLSRFGADARVQEIRTTSLSVAPGYTYSLIFKGFFLNGTLAVGPAYNRVRYAEADSGADFGAKLNVFVAARLGIGYNGDRFFGGLSVMNQSTTARLGEAELNSANGIFKMVFGYRFKEGGFLRNRIWDLPKAFR
ncbi:MAG TPA: DUF4421 family protein [Ohtaekwangia sp.]|nr:DUF4421 family protein [Ohtaekwangia sp.]